MKLLMAKRIERSPFDAYPLDLIGLQRVANLLMGEEVLVDSLGSDRRLIQRLIM